MQGIEGGAEQGEKRKRVEAWHAILSSGELIKMQEEVLASLEEKMRSRGILRDEFTSFIKNGEIEARPLEDTPTLSYPGLATRRNTFQHVYKTGKGEPSLLRCVSNSENLDEHERTLFQVFAFLYKQAKELSENDSTISAPEIKEIYRQHTELASPSKILLDNVQTYFDISRFVTQNATNTEEQKHTIQRLYSERPAYTYRRPGGNGEINLNPQLETNIELLGRAPLGFWGPSRYDIPVSIDGEAVLNDRDDNQSLFSSKFIYMTTRDHIQIKHPEEEATESLIRHGGCPILHKDFKENDLMQKTGEVYLRLYAFLSKADTNLKPA